MFSPHHVRLVSSCYPAAPLAAGPDFKPNTQELSRLTYFGSNKPGKLAKIGQELEKHAQAEARRARTHPKARASLLITLDILKTLCTECRQEISLFGRYVVASVDHAISSLAHDLEVAARSASVFTSYTTFTDGKSGAVEEPLCQNYLSALHSFAFMSTTGMQQTDDELRARFRLVGLAALTAAIGSDALYSSLELGRAQVAIFVPVLLHNAQDAGLSVLQQQEIVVEESQANSPYFSEFQPHQPVAQRRAASIHMHQDGVEGPTMTDVTFSSLKAMKNLLGRSDGPQVTIFLASLFKSLTVSFGWGNVDLCCWLALHITEWTQYQHRYAIPIQLVNKLVETPDNAIHHSGVHETLIAMITAVFSSRTPIANLATSDVITSLIDFILRRVERDPHDAILPAMVKCVSSLATHLYYADQIQDFAEEIIQKLTEVQLSNVGSGSAGRQEGMRCLVSCLSGLIAVAARHTTVQEPPHRDGKGIKNRSASPSSGIADVHCEPERGASVGSVGGRRNLISPETWQETLAILVEADYGLRAEYARTLAMFIDTEIPKEPPLRVERPSEAGLIPKSTVNVSGSDETVRFLHAMHATVYALAVAPTLGLHAAGATVSGNTTSIATSSERSPVTPVTPASQSSTSTDTSTTATSVTVQLNFIDSTPTQSPTAEEPASPSTMSTSGGHKTSAASANLQHRHARRPRTASLALSLIDPIESSGAYLVHPAPSPACPNDYSHAVAIMSSAVQRTPARAILTGVPMLLALDKISCAPLVNSDNDVLRGRRQAMREGIAQLWAVIASVIESSELQELSQRALKSLPPSTVLPTISGVRDNFSQPAERPHEFPSGDAQDSPGLPPGPLGPIMDPETALTALASSGKFRELTRLDRQGILRRLAVQWSPASALTNSTEKFAAHDNSPRLEGSMPFLKLAPGLMNIDNKSLQSLARSTRNVGVGDLRDALEGRASANRSAIGLGYPGSPSMSSIGNHSALLDHSGDPSGHGLSHLQARLRATHAIKEANGEVKDILNKLGIGKQSSARGGKTKAAFKASLLPSPKRGNSHSPSGTPT